MPSKLKNRQLTNDELKIRKLEAQKSLHSLSGWKPDIIVEAGALIDQCNPWCDQPGAVQMVLECKAAIDEACAYRKPQDSRWFAALMRRITVLLLATSMLNKRKGPSGQVILPTTIRRHGTSAKYIQPPWEKNAFVWWSQAAEEFTGMLEGRPAGHYFATFAKDRSHETPTTNKPIVPELISWDDSDNDAITCLEDDEASFSKQYMSLELGTVDHGVDAHAEHKAADNQKINSTPPSHVPADTSCKVGKKNRSAMDMRERIRQQRIMIREQERTIRKQDDIIRRLEKALSEKTANK